MGLRGNFYTGVFKPLYPSKYIGKKKISYRSGLELGFLKYLDSNPKILKWAYECMVVPYFFEGGWHKYYVDFFVILQDGRRLAIELKPYKETHAPKAGKKNRKTVLYEQFTWAKNSAKWLAAEEFCKKRGIEFKKLTEKDITI